MRRIIGIPHNPSWSGTTALEWTDQPSSDTTPPSTPTNLTAAAVSSSQINLSWTASTDNVGVTGYSVERCQGSACTNFSQISTPGGTSYSDTGLVANTTYRYRVRATDAAGNLSSYSSIASAATPNNQPPAVNAGPDQTVTLLAGATLTGTATDDGLPSGTLTVQWSMASGPAPVVFSAPQSTTTGVTFALPGTYVFRLSASDSQLTSTDDVTVTVNPL
ncbi:MAG TPA: fibronectin type III domain-containing protein [Terriglobia bacterium]|nr:fibronectin type III domain-containing protein [Terriglobia bacterium]